MCQQRALPKTKVSQEDHRNLFNPLRAPWRYKTFLPLTVRILENLGLAQHLAPKVLRLAPNRILKYGINTTLAEARSIDLVATCTSIPVPKIIAAFKAKNGECYILMTRCPGVPLCNVFRNLEAKQQEDVLGQLHDIVDQIRAIKPLKPGHVGLTDYTAINDERVHESPCGPFESVSDFHKAIRTGATSPSGFDDVDAMIALQDERDYPITFTHSDLSFRNMLYQNGKITGVVDWESSGWYPDYWEYAMTHDSFWDSPDLRDKIKDFMDPFIEELKMEQTRRKYFRGQ
jgi:aminoglycoside phosphotransferase